MSASRRIPRVKPKDIGLKQTRGIARAMLIGHFSRVEVKEDPRGLTQEHMAWMLHRVVHDKAFTLAKANRWLGYVQGWLVITQRESLEYVKESVRAAKGEPWKS